MNRLAIFDCDGTLVDSQVNICRAMETVFADARIEGPARDAVRRVVGLSLTEAMEALLPDADRATHRVLAANYKIVFQRMRGQGMVEEPLFDGIAEVVAALDDAGWLLGVATGKSDRGLALCLAAHGILGRFATLQTADRHPSKPHPAMIDACIADTGASPETTVMIGDTSFDMAMAQAAGVRAIGVNWGYHPAAELRMAGAASVAGHPHDLINLMEMA